MSVRIDASGRRSVQVEVEAPGSIEEVWRAISTGPGISSWFVPTEFDAGAGDRLGRLVCHFGPGMDSVATLTEWDAPRRFAVESEDFVVGGPPVATVWTVEKGGGDAWVVRVEHSLFADSDEYDGPLEGTESGWPQFFRILQIYMTHYRGQPCALLELMGTAPNEVSAWGALTADLGLANAKAGERRSAPADAPALTGSVDHVPNDAEMLLQLTEPTTGVAHLLAMPAGEQTLLSVRLYLYGDDAAAVAARDGQLWQEWMQARFPFSPA